MKNFLFFIMAFCIIGIVIFNWDDIKDEIEFFFFIMTPGMWFALLFCLCLIVYFFIEVYK